MTVIDADLWCGGDYSNENRDPCKLTGKEVSKSWQKEREREPFLHKSASESHLLRLRILRQGSLWMFGEASFTPTFTLI